MTPVFGHGRLRLYLLKLLDESPRHGYEIIRLLQDRFLGLYAPSAGTVYPRLAKLEQEGLVTHAVEGGRKVYRITAAGRAELAERQPELDALEAEIRESVYERAREIRDEVRTSARNLREELRQAARDVHDSGRTTAAGPAAAKAAKARAGGDDPVSAWAKNIGPALSQKMVDLAEGLAQGLAGLTEQHAQNLEDELRRRFRTGEAGPGARPASGGVNAAPAGGKAAEDPWRAETDGGAAEEHDWPSDRFGPPGGVRAHGASGRPRREAKGSGGAGGADQVSAELGRLFERFRGEIDAVAGRAGLTPSQVDRARDVLVRACTDLKDILDE